MNAPRCSHVTFPEGACRAEAELKLLTVGCPTWLVCEAHLWSRLDIMLGLADELRPVTVVRLRAIHAR